MAVYQELKLEQLSQSVVTNSSRVRILWTSTQTGPSWNNISDFAYIYYSVNGQAEVKKSVEYYLPEKTTVTIMDLTIEIPHNTNGEATLKVRTWANTHISAGIVQLEQTLVLDPIAPTTIVASDGFIGDASTLKLTKHNNLYVNTIQFTFGSQSGYICGDGSISAEPVMLSVNEISFALPESFYEEIPNDPSGVCQLVCTTYMDNAQVGRATESSFNVLTDEQVCGPQVAGSVFDINDATLSLTGDNQIFVRYHSNAQCFITPVALKAATIVKKWINGVEMVAGDTLVIPQITQDNVVFKVQDSRGYEATFVQPLELKLYTSLTNNAQLSRDDPTSGKATLTFSGSWFNDSFGSTFNELVLQYRIDSGEYITVEAVTFDGNSYKAIVNLTDLDYRKIFEFTVRVSDKLGESIKRLTLKKGIPVFDWGENDFSFRVPVQMDGNLNVDGMLTVGGKSLVDMFYPVGTVYMTTLTIDPSALFGGTWEQLQSNDEAVFKWNRTS